MATPSHAHSQERSEGYRPFTGRTRAPKPSQPLVRVAETRDRDAITDILVHGLGAKLIPAFGALAREAVGAMLDAELRSSTCGYHVAILDNQVAGVVHLDTGQSRDSALLDDIRRAVGWRATIRAALVLGALAPPVPNRDEGMIEELAVHPAARRRGVASALIQRCEIEAIARDRGTLILQVTSDNDGALALYRRAGFHVRSEKRWILRQRLFRSPGALIMERPIR